MTVDDILDCIQVAIYWTGVAALVAIGIICTGPWALLSGIWEGACIAYRALPALLEGRRVLKRRKELLRRG